MDKKKGILEYSFWIHLVIIGALFLMPIMFTAPDEPITFTTYLHRSVVPLTVLAVFYLNFYWVVPIRLMKRHDRQFFWIFNVVLVTFLALGLTYWTDHMHRVHEQERIAQGIIHEHRPHDNSPTIFPFFVLFRCFYNLSVAVALAAALRMSNRWMELEKQSKEAEVALREAELTNLRSQINPHFLLNTLNNIYALTAFDQAKAQQAVMHLSKMLRHVLYDADQLVNLRDEVDFLHNYIDLMKIRVPGNVEVLEHFDIPSPCTTQIASMIFISLVENAFKHGISPTAPSFIHVSVVADEHQIVCEISNTYYPKTSKDQSGHGIGLQQVTRRLDLLYPDLYTWERGPSADGKYYQSKLIIHDTKLHHH